MGTLLTVIYAALGIAMGAFLLTLAVAVIAYNRLMGDEDE